MVCFSFFLALLATASSALPFNSREDNAWLTLQAIDSFLSRYIGPEVDNWNGSLQGILVFDRDAATVYQVVEGAKNNNLELPAASLNSQDSQSIDSYLQKNLRPHLQEILNDITAAKATYEQPAVPSIVKSTIDGLGARTGQYVSSLAHIVSGNLTNSVTKTGQNIQLDVDKALASIS